ncbi:MAG: AAA family ATPase [Candidatus Buchananbacteria bacterium]
MEQTNTIIAVVGLPGSGKSEVVRFMQNKGFFKIYFGAVTFDEIEKRGLETNEKNERMVREELRANLGMGAYAILNIEKIRNAFENGNVVIESMYSWQEYQILKEEFKDNFSVIAVYASPATRYDRIVRRKEIQNNKERLFNLEEVKSRDKAQIENLAIAGPIAIADFTIINETGMEDLYKQIDQLMEKLNVQK